MPMIVRTGPLEADMRAATRNTPAERAAAALTVAIHATDPADRDRLLGMLGLIDAPRAQWRRA